MVEKYYSGPWRLCKRDGDGGSSSMKLPGRTEECSTFTCLIKKKNYIYNGNHEVSRD
jgi:hypothetical protein